MASVPDVAPFLRKPRVGPTQKARPLMKLEWNKLLAEATEKDIELKKDIVNEEYYDDECEFEKEDDNGKLNCNEIPEEKPLNLCNKSHTMPIFGNNFPDSFNVLDLSAKKKKPIGSKTSNELSEQNSSSISNLEFDKNSPKKLINVVAFKANEKQYDDNKENIPGNLKDKEESKVDLKESIVCEKIKKHIENVNVDKYLKPIIQENPIFFSEKKMPPKSIRSEKVRISKDDIYEKIDSAPKHGKNDDNEKLNKFTDASIPMQKKLQFSKFAIPATPSKESSRVLIINKKSYQILAPLGKGGSSKVYLVLNSENELLAVKCVKLSDVSESIKNDYLNEIQHLMKMQHSKHVIRLYDYQYLSSQKILFAVMERGETDLSRFLKDKASSDEGISSELIMYYWTEMLLAVKSIHDNNIIHRDLKPANFLLVSGRLKLIDFGIASSIQTEQTSIFMESQSGTFNYMSPEALQDLGFDNKVLLKISRKTDVWSLGCILYYFLYKKTPYQDLVKPLHKFKAITDPNYVVPFHKISGVPDILIESCKRCLIHNPKERASIDELLAYRNRPVFSLSQVLVKLENILSVEEYNKAKKAFEETCSGNE